MKGRAACRRSGPSLSMHTSTVDTSGAVLLGSQVPTYTWAATGVSSAAPEAVGIAAKAGLNLDPWQRFVLDGALQENEDFTWTNNEVLVIVPRQSGKGGIIEGRELAGIFVWDEPYIMHSAHEMKTASEAFQRMEELLESNEDFDRRIQAVSRSKGLEGFVFQWDHGNYRDGKDPRCRKCRLKNRKKHRANLRYVSRSGGSARGFAGVSTVILDEAMILDEAPIASMLPTLATASAVNGNWQVWYLGSAGDRTMRSSSVVMGRQRRRVLAKQPGVAGFLFEAHLRHDKKRCVKDPVTGEYDHPLDDRLDPRTWAKVNPAMGPISMGRRVTQEFLAKMANGGMAERDFDREFLSDGDYLEPEGWDVITEEAWTNLRDRALIGGGAPERFAIGVDTTWDGQYTAITIAGTMPDGRMLLEMLICQAGTAWAPDYLAQLLTYKPRAIVLSRQSPADVIVPDLQANRKMKKLLKFPTLTEYATWSKKTVQLMTETRTLVHLGQSTMDAAVKAVKKNDVGGGSFVLTQRGATGNAAPFTAGVNAIGGFVSAPKSTSGRPLVASA